MAFMIDDPDVERLARNLAAATGESVPRAVAVAVRERLARVQHARASQAPAPGAGPDRPVLATVAEIQAYMAALPELDPRPADEILGYDGTGLPH